MAKFQKVWRSIPPQWIAYDHVQLHNEVHSIWVL